MRISPGETIRVAISSVWIHRFRSLLTILGIVMISLNQVLGSALSAYGEIKNKQELLAQARYAMERMVVMAPDKVLTPDLMPPEVRRGEDPSLPPVFDQDGLLPLREAEVAFRKQHFGRALTMTGGNQTKAAELLGIQRGSLNRQMKELGLRRDTSTG